MPFGGKTGATWFAYSSHTFWNPAAKGKTAVPCSPPGVCLRPLAGAARYILFYALINESKANAIGRAELWVIDQTFSSLEVAGSVTNYELRDGKRLALPTIWFFSVRS